MLSTVHFVLIFMLFFRLCLSHVDIQNIHEGVRQSDQLKADKDVFCNSKYLAVLPMYYQDTRQENVIVKTENKEYRVDVVNRKFLGEHTHQAFPEGVLVLCSLKTNDHFHLVVVYHHELWIYLHQGSNRYDHRKINNVVLKDNDFQQFTGCSDCDQVEFDNQSIISFRMSGIIENKFIKLMVYRQYNNQYNGEELEIFKEMPIPTVAFLCRSFAYLPKSEVSIQLDNHQNIFITYEKIKSNEVTTMRDLIECPETSGMAFYVESMLAFLLACAFVCAITLNYSLPIKQELDELIYLLRNVRPKMPVRKTLTSSGSGASDSKGSTGLRTQQDSIHTIDSSTGSVIQNVGNIGHN